MVPSCLPQIDVAGVQTLAMRISYTGELGWELYHPRQSTAHMYQAILEAGEEFGERYSAKFQAICRAIGCNV